MGAHTIIHYLYANTVEKHSEWIEGSRQKEAFLIEGQPKQFTCTSFGKLYNSNVCLLLLQLLVFVCV